MNESSSLAHLVTNISLVMPDFEAPLRYLVTNVSLVMPNSEAPLRYLVTNVSLVMPDFEAPLRLQLAKQAKAASRASSSSPRRAQ